MAWTEKPIFATVNKLISSYSGFEQCLVVYLLSGVFKQIAVLYGVVLPFDLTIVSGVLLLCYLLLFAVNGAFLGKRYNAYFIASLTSLLLFTVWLFGSYLLSDSTVYKHQKLLGYATGLLVFFVASTAPVFNVKGFLKWFVIISTLGSLIYLYATAHWRQYPNYFEVKDMYLYIGRIQGLVALLVWYRFKELFGWNLLTRLSFTLMSIALVLFLGARGPFLFLVITFFIVFTYQWIKGVIRFPVMAGSKLRVVLTSLAIGGVVMIIPFGLDQLDAEVFGRMVQRAWHRFSLLIGFLDLSPDTSAGYSITNRIDLLKFAVDATFSDLKTMLFGNGFGSFGLAYENTDSSKYPHNVPMEVWFELGLVGLSLFSIFLFTALAKLQNRAWVLVPAAIFIFELLNIQKSYSLGDLRLLFFFLAINLNGVANNEQNFVQQRKA